MIAQSQIKDLVQQKLSGRRIDISSVVHELLLLTLEVGEIRCIPVSDEVLGFQVRDHGNTEVTLDAARGKLRSMCARLGVLCQENGQDVSLYGGEGVINGAQVAGSTNMSGNHPHGLWRVSFKNTPGEHEFIITALEG